jgi:acyl-ACP thioesterase
MYTLESRIRYSEVDSEGKLTLLSLLDYFQDCSTFQSEDLGLGVGYLREKHKVWLMSFWQIDIDRYANLCEHVKITTHPYEFKHCLGFRNFGMIGEDQEQIAVANTLWTLVDTETGKMSKPEQEMLERYALEPKADMEYLSRKINFTQQGEAEAPILVGRHHLDTNHHVNNGQYVAIACDLIPEDFKIDRMRASYHKQAFLGDILYPVIYRESEHCIGISLNDSEGEPYAKIEFTQRI